MDLISRRKIAVLYGTRSEAVKLAPVINELKRRNTHIPHVVTCGRQRGMLDQINRLFDITPDHDLDMLRRGYSLDDVLVGAIRGFSEYLDAHPVDAVVVQGGATVAFTGALTAYHRQIPVVHVDAGLRSGDIYSPFPEEGNRKFISSIAARHCAPSTRAARNLHLEHVAEQHIVVTGDTIIDSLMHTASRPQTVSDPVIETAIQERRRLILVTAQWRESWGDESARVAQALVQIADRFPDVVIAVPLDGGPAVRDVIAPLLLRTQNIRLTGPLPYAEFSRMLSRATLVVTDSAAIHEEAPAFAVPVVITRDTTERPEMLEADGGVLVSVDTEQITAALSALLTDRELHRRTAAASGPYGDGHAAARVVDVIEHLLASRRADGDTGWTASALAR